MNNCPAGLGWMALLVAILLLPACKSSRPATGRIDEKLSARAVLDRMVRNQVRAEWLDARARIGFAGDGTEASATANIKLRRDSVIWISVKKFGFEVARAQVTKDSVYVVNRIDNEYTIAPLSYLAEKYRLPADYSMIEQLLLGNPILWVRDGWQSETEEGLYRLQAKRGAEENHLWVSPGNFKLQRMEFRDEADGRRLDVKLDKYSRLDSQTEFSYLREIELNSRETGPATVEIEYSQIEINVPTSIRFEIPAHYQRAD